MKLLSVECSATPCSVAISENGKILASSFSNVKLTHSQTLMPMVESVLKSSLIDIKEIDAFAVSNGPGSFTGVRIGISAIKGMAQAKNLPCVEVSTLEAMAQNYSDTNCIVCAVMDARCNQVYNGLFNCKKGEIVRLCEDRAMAIDDLKAEIKKLSKKRLPIYIVGDGAEIFYSHIKDFKNVYLASEHRRFQNAVGVSVVAEKEIQNENVTTPAKLLPKYLRLPQAERELKRKEEQK